MNRTVAPELGLKSFSCPHCGALSHQTWFHVYADAYARDRSPEVVTPSDEFWNDLKKIEDEKLRKRLEVLKGRLERNLLAHENLSSGVYCEFRMTNLELSRCYSCDGFGVWFYGSLIYPTHEVEHAPHEDMPVEVRTIFEEAASIVSRSPRAAAALLRLALQKLLVVLGEKGAKIDDDIASLAAKGLDPIIKQALDVVR